MTKIAVIGAGTQAKAVVDYLLRFTDCEIGVLDKDHKAAEKLKNFAQLSGNDNRVHVSSGVDIASDFFVQWLSHYDAAVSCVPYFLNKTLTEQAIKAKTHLTDLGGNNDVVKAQLAMSEQAEQAGVLVIPDLGLAPGLAGLLGADLVRSMEGEYKQLSLRVGGLPVEPQTPLNYALSFSVHGLLNEYLDDCVIIRDGEKVIAEGLDDLVSLDIADFSHFSSLECFNTSGGISTLTDSLLGEVNFADYKTIRYAGHCQMIRLLDELGYFEPDKIEDTKKRLENILPKNEKDVILMYLYAEDTNGIKTVSMEDYGDWDRSISAMARCTGYPAAIITYMIANGDIKARGVVPQENCVDVTKFRELLEQTGIKLVYK